MSQTKNTASQPLQASAPAAAAAASESASGVSTTPRPKGLPLYKIYELPAPIRTFPLPSFYPNNPISLFHVIFAWAKQSLFPPPAEPSIVHEGVWSPTSKSINIIDEKSMRALWEQGFYGKGNLSRSEPNWLKREHVRRGLVPGQVSELVTASRREERRQMKWERAKSEQEAIRQLRIREAQLAANQTAADDTVKPSSPSVETEESPAKTQSTHVPAREASTDTEPLPESTSSLSKSDVAVNDTKTGVPEVSRDSEVAVFTEPEALELSLEDDAPTVDEPAIELTNGTSSQAVASTITAAHPSLPLKPEAHIHSGKIAKPSDFLQSREEASGVVVDSKTVVKSEDALPTPLSLSLAPVGPTELLSLPNSHGFVAATTEQIAEASMNGDSQKVVVQHLEPADSDPESTNDTSQHSLTNGHSVPVVATIFPVGPLELLSLPNTNTPLVNGTSIDDANDVDSGSTANFPTVVEKLSTIHENAAFADSENKSRTVTGHLINDLVNGVNGERAAHLNGLNGVAKSAVASADIPSTPKSTKRRKSVRFSPKVESATYELSDPPSPSLALFNVTNGKGMVPANGTALGPSVLEAESKDITKSDDSKSLETLTEVEAESTETIEIVNKEHLQLTSEEAFFLAFGMGALRVVDHVTKAPIPTVELFNLFRSYSYFPSRKVEELQPDDGFLVNYAVYHHFRSLGWVPRAGIKFGVDWMLYARGPVFDHAEFGAIILPSYSDQWWKDSDRQLPRKTWHWLHGVVRVLSHVQKSLVLVYVDVPAPPQFDEAMKKGPTEVFKLYKIREVMVKRWSSNRNR
ncbi:tRNA intron endonuclease [Colletotrichum higginsianum]|uniref:tRNA-intron lyase n=1 Tax=Colletotrichum higginsianum (strain IMI 349063) TaxID=759273 RepID=H1V3L4_COLHI|nr:tRNA intron endonuclease [Colletotrichum higginsianum IMI 349063]OBR11590.1 tRNA intron endonuclease [Colletotrichum higginsianum IMI 349063]CCF34816.1 tRNA intron endonuclease [Colletotrichum higginsianum]